MLRKLFLLLLIIGAAAGAGGYVLLWASAGPKPGPHTIVVQEGSSLAKVTDQLVAAGAVPGSATTYRAMAKLFASGDPVQAGCLRLVVQARPRQARIVGRRQQGEGGPLPGAGRARAQALIDAGAERAGYCADVTRTWGNGDAAFASLVKGRPVYPALSGKTMEFDGAAKCVAGC